MVNVWIFFRISGGLFNPAVTLGMALVGAVPVVRSICLFIAQIAGGIAASAMVRFLFPTEFNVRTTLAGGTSLVQGVFIEAFLTAELVFTIFMLAKEKHKATFIAPVGIGLALFISEMVGGMLLQLDSSQDMLMLKFDSLLHRWILEPSKKFRTMCRHWHVRP